MPAGPAIAEAGEHYTDVYYASTEPRPDEDRWERAALDVSMRRMRRIEHVLGRKGRVLDVGSGTGFQLAGAKALGWDVQGVEVSETAAAFARSRHDVLVVVGTLAEAAFDDSSFDAVTMVHVLEHVPDPIGLLRELQRIVRPGGVVSVAVPHPRALVHDAYNLFHRLRGRYAKDKYACGLYPPDHLYSFTRTALTTAMRTSGFTVVRTEVTGKGDPEHYPMVSWRGAGRAPAVERSLEWLGRRIGRASILDCIAVRT